MREGRAFEKRNMICNYANEAVDQYSVAHSKWALHFWGD